MKEREYFVIVFKCKYIDNDKVRSSVDFSTISISIEDFLEDLADAIKTIVKENGNDYTIDFDRTSILISGRKFTSKKNDVSLQTFLLNLLHMNLIPVNYYQFLVDHKFDKEYIPGDMIDLEL